MKNVIKITVEGAEGTGKSTITQLIKEMLLDENFNTTVDSSVEIRSNESYKDRRQREKVVLKSTELVLSEKQTPRIALR